MVDPEVIKFETNVIEPSACNQDLHQPAESLAFLFEVSTIRNLGEVFAFSEQEEPGCLAGEAAVDGRGFDREWRGFLNRHTIARVFKVRQIRFCLGPAWQGRSAESVAVEFVPTPGINYPNSGVMFLYIVPFVGDGEVKGSQRIRRPIQQSGRRPVMLHKEVP